MYWLCIWIARMNGKAFRRFLPILFAIWWNTRFNSGKENGSQTESERCVCQSKPHAEFCLYWPVFLHSVMFSLVNIVKADRLDSKHLELHIMYYLFQYCWWPLESPCYECGMIHENWEMHVKCKYDCVTGSLLYDHDVNYYCFLLLSNLPEAC